ncbi:hypothetical protein LH464_04120 [Neorhizobium sp. T786]|uniref:hypothetical protein n=1 Tax=Pseudorhizobium xiangyangii TaxID=2883104 RepID=UPI001CFF572A|nr:hypothetical protein [Neorhizobium xiangyangii]MCB5201663.1 hypothetical protein [Neorhizobium xiangyangii]
MSMKERWNSPANKAALKAIPVSLFAAAGVTGVVAAMGGSPSLGIFGIIWLLTYAFTASAMMKKAKP